MTTKTDKKDPQKPRNKSGKKTGANSHAKTGKKSPEQQLKIREAIMRTALEIAAAEGWGKVSLPAIASAAALSLPEVRAHFKDRNDILRAYEELIDDRVLKNLGTIDEDANPRETLFDIVMERFDILNEERAGMIAILDHAKCDPALIARTMPHLGQTMANMLEAAHIDTSGLKGMAHILGLTGVYLMTLKTWRDDESPDMSKTMAALDRNLGRAEQLGASLKII